MAQCLSPFDLKTLRCEKCKNYLSMPPVIFASNNYFCGRCRTLGSRARAYETLAKKVLFPCIYDNSGCKQQLPFEKTLEHEAKCDFAPKSCPIFSCTKKLDKKPKTVLEHFLKEHRDLLLEADGLSVPRKADFVKIRGVVDGDNLYLLQMRGLANNPTFHLSLKTLAERRNVFYNLEIHSRNGNKIVKTRQPVTLFDFDHKADEGSRLNHEEIESVLGSPDYSFGIKIFENEENHLQELQCIACKEFTTPPIYVCKNGHSLCHRCQGKIFECPSCRGRFDSVRNVHLEKHEELCGQSGPPRRNVYVIPSRRGRENYTSSLTDFRIHR